MQDSKLFWKEKRREYNRYLIVAILIAAFIYLLLVELAPSNRIEALEIEVTFFTLIFQALGAVIFIITANICYSLAAKLADLLGFESELAFRIGLVFSILLVSLLPVSLFLRLMF